MERSTNMSGTLAGGKKTAQTNKEKYGENYYKELGRKGGSVHHPETRWFNNHRDLAQKWGKKGGKISKRGKAKLSKNDFQVIVKTSNLIKKYYPDLLRELAEYDELERKNNEK